MYLSLSLYIYIYIHTHIRIYTHTYTTKDNNFARSRIFVPDDLSRTIRFDTPGNLSRTICGFEQTLTCYDFLKRRLPKNNISKNINQYNTDVVNNYKINKVSNLKNTYYDLSRTIHRNIAEDRFSGLYYLCMYVCVYIYIIIYIYIYMYIYIYTYTHTYIHTHVHITHYYHYRHCYSHYTCYYYYIHYTGLGWRGHKVP